MFVACCSGKVSGDKLIAHLEESYFVCVCVCVCVCACNVV